MNKLIHELQRLYFLDGSASTDRAAAGLLTPELIAQCLDGEGIAGLELVSADGLIRAMVVGFEKASDWEQVAKLYQGIQEDLELPAPAISVSGHTGYQLWLSLAACVSVVDARLFLDALRLKYLADLSLASLQLIPDADRSVVNLVPAFHQATGKWSAFIDPSMGAMFIEESGLDMAPNMDRQADMLSRLKSIKAGDFARALSILQSEAESNARLLEESAAEQRENPRHPSAVDQTRAKLSVGDNYTDPKTFLLAVMNDASASADHRIKAAKALLPYFHGFASE